MASNRIDMVDALRGYALLGLFLVHCVERFELYWLEPQPGGWFDITMALFAGKSFAIFALLFGFSFATIMANERTRGGDFTWRFAWRLALLFVIGTLHALIYRGDILQVLAAVGLILIAAGTPMARRPTLDDRLAPYLRDAPRPSKLLTTSGTLTPFPTFERLLRPRRTRSGAARRALAPPRCPRRPARQSCSPCPPPRP